jgi:peptidoglycan/LPS O-acetylase OafA/YrhL
LNPGQAQAVNYRPDVDGLRSIAIVSVVLFHANVRAVRGGFVGVDVFFVISGFLIGSLIFREMTEGRFTLRKFYERRAKRILPALFAVLLLCLVPALLLLSGLELEGFAAEMLGTLTSTSNIYFAKNSDYFASAAEMHPLLMTWSLGVEEQFYIFFPLVMYVLMRFGKRVVVPWVALLSLASFIIAAWSLTLYPTQTFYLLPARAWELGLGTMLGIYEVGRVSKQEESGGRDWAHEVVSMAGLAMLLLGIFAFGKGTLFPGVNALLPTAGTALLIFGRRSWLNRRVLSLRPLVGIGLVSYSWYLWHWPLMSFARVTRAGVLPVQIGLAITVISFGLAVASYYLIEQPTRRPSKAGKSILLRYGLGSAAMCVPAFVLLLAHGWPARYPAAARFDMAHAQSKEDPCLVRYRVSRPLNSATCHPPGRSPALALMGDSHAAALGSELRRAGEAVHWRVLDYTKASCPQLGEVTPFFPSRRHHESECALYNRSALDSVLADRDVKVVLLAGFWAAQFPESDYGVRFVHAGQEPSKVSLEASWENFEQGLQTTTQELRRAGKRVVLAADVPRFAFDPVFAVRTETIPLRDRLNALLRGPVLRKGSVKVSEAVTPVDVRVNAAIRRVANNTGADVWDPTASLCVSGQCRFAEKSTALYVDSQHLSATGAHVALQGNSLFVSGEKSAK